MWPARIGAVLTVLALLAPPVAATPEDPLWTEFDQSVYGDFVTVGNTVTTCPPDSDPMPSHYPAQRCRAAQNGEGSGVPALNNSHYMTWADVDNDQSTFDSSSARLTVPPGADIAYAKLTWAGNTGDQTGLPCGHASPRPAGDPTRQPVSLTVGDRPTATIGPDRFRLRADADADLTNTDQRFYSGHSDVTREFLGMPTGVPVTVTVGNVWTPRGFDCFGGWSVVVVWKFDTPSPRHAPARKQVQVHGGHLRVFTSMDKATARLGSMRAAGGVTRLGITAYEGDWATHGDGLLVNGVAQAPEDNFFDSHAEGALTPAVTNNMSVDVTTVEVPDSVIRAHDTSAEVTVTSTTDAYLLTSLAVSLPAPALVVTTSVDRPTAHPGDPVTQTATVTNPSTAPADQVTVRLSAAEGCDHTVGTLPGTTSTTVRCTGPALDDDYRLTTTVNGTSPIDDELTAEADTGVEVLRPAIDIRTTAQPATVLPGQQVEFHVNVHNTGDTPLSELHLTGNGCEPLNPASTAPAHRTTGRCVLTAGAEGLTHTVTVNGKDRLGLAVSATVTVIHPRAATAGPAVRHDEPSAWTPPTKPATAAGIAALTLITSLLVFAGMNAARR